VLYSDIIFGRLGLSAFELFTLWSHYW